MCWYFHLLAGFVFLFAHKYGINHMKLAVGLKVARPGVVNNHRRRKIACEIFGEA